MSIYEVKNYFKSHVQSERPISIPPSGHFTNLNGGLTMGQSDLNGRELAVLSAAERKLAACTDFHEVLEIRHDAETVRHYAQKQRRGLKLQNQAAKIKILAERRIGEALADMKLKGGDRKSKSTGRTLIPQLKEMGITRNQSSQWQLEAKISIEQFDAFYRHLEAEGSELSSKGFCRFIRTTYRRKQPTPRSRRKPAFGAVTRPQRDRSLDAEIEDVFSAIRGHVQTALRVFVDICKREPTTLERIEKQEVPRFLRESLGGLEQLEQWVKQLLIGDHSTDDGSAAGKSPFTQVVSQNQKGS
jgi:hypothetical protein